MHLVEHKKCRRLMYRFTIFDFGNKSKPVNKQVGGSPDVSIQHH